MRWFRKLIWRITKRAWEDHEEFNAEENQKARRTLKQSRIRGSLFNNEVETISSSEGHLRAYSMNFRLYKCVGGHILESSIYNSKEDEHQHTLYMIHEDQDFAKQVAQSIMMEQIKQ